MTYGVLLSSYKISQDTEQISAGRGISPDQTHLAKCWSNLVRQMQQIKQSALLVFMAQKKNWPRHWSAAFQCSHAVSTSHLSACAAYFKGLSAVQKTQPYQPVQIKLPCQEKVKRSKTLFNTQKVKRLICCWWLIMSKYKVASSNIYKQEQRFKRCGQIIRRF